MEDRQALTATGLPALPKYRPPGTSAAPLGFRRTGLAASKVNAPDLPDTNTIQAQSKATKLSKATQASAVGQIPPEGEETRGGQSSEDGLNQTIKVSLR